MTKLKKDDFIALLSEELQTTKVEAKRIYESFVNVADTVLIDNQQGFPLGHLGAFKVDVKPEREHTNPQDPTGDKIVKPAHFAMKFQPSANAKKALSELEVN